MTSDEVYVRLGNTLRQEITGLHKRAERAEVQVAALTEEARNLAAALEKMRERAETAEARLAALTKVIHDSMPLDMPAFKTRGLPTGERED